MNYLKPTTSDKQIYDIIYDKIKTKTPFCLTRFGDGEIYFMNRNAPDWLQMKVCKLWNYHWPNDMNKIYYELNLIFDSALEGSDVIGLLNPNNPICKTIKYDDKKWSISTDKVSKNILICDNQIVRNKLFGNIKNFKKIIQGRSVNIISPNTVRLQDNNLDELLETDVTYYHIDNDRKKMLESLLSIKSDIVLYGASLYGKDLGVILKSYGKIAIDFGATLDAWAGLVTRPWFNEGQGQEHCLIRR